MKDKTKHNVKNMLIVLLIAGFGGYEFMLKPESDPQPESQQYYMKLDGDFDDSETKSVLIQKELRQSDKHSEWVKVQVIQ